MRLSCYCSTRLSTSRVATIAPTLTKTPGQSQPGDPGGDGDRADRKPVGARFKRALVRSDCSYILCRRPQEQPAGGKYSRARQDACWEVKNGREGYENLLRLLDTH